MRDVQPIGGLEMQKLPDTPGSIHMRKEKQERQRLIARFRTVYRQVCFGIASVRGCVDRETAEESARVEEQLGSWMTDSQIHELKSSVWENGY